MFYSLIYLSCNFWLRMNSNKFYCVSELKQWLVNVWQSAAEYCWCSHQQVDKMTDSMRACRWTTFWTLLWAFHKTKKNHGQTNCKYPGLFSKKMFLYDWLCDFQVSKVFQGKVCTLNRWGGKINHFSMAYFFSNICTKNYLNWTGQLLLKLSLVVG